ncbi:MAG: methyltransferase domain-containing protein [Clostridia bacterium]|nr:methyltransferase domain-containing protein [Clostridia bacterium]
MSTIEAVLQGIDVRQNLSRLRQEIKNTNTVEKRELKRRLIQEKESMLCLLTDEDAKTRKNVALLIGDLALQSFLSPLLDAYQAETQRFVKTSYLKAVKSLDYKDYLPLFKECREKLLGEELSADNKKHIEEELQCLNDLIILKEGMKRHRYHGTDVQTECIFMTNKQYLYVLQNQIEQVDEHAEFLPFAAGVRVLTKRLVDLLPLRTYRELLFVIPGMKVCESDPQKAAERIAHSDLLAFIKRTHDGTPPYYFRLEVKSHMTLDEKSTFTKKLSRGIEELSGRTLLNSTSHYEFEIRLIENKEHTFNVLLKLYTIKDDRFEYRKEYLSSSIKPVNAALLVQLASDYMISDAQVLDPFCGVGTMLIERQKVIKANTSYGIDSSKEAILKARENTEAAGQVIHYINRDFFDFKHEYLFDEIFTNMPYACGYVTQESIRELYISFFGTASLVLTKRGRILMLTHDLPLAIPCAAKNQYRLIEKWEISKTEMTYLVIFEKE